MIFGMDISFKGNLPSSQEILARIHTNTGFWAIVEEDGAIFIDPFLKNAELSVIRKNNNSFELYSFVGNSYIMQVVIASLVDLGGELEYPFRFSPWANEPFEEVKKRAGELGLLG